MQPVTPQIIQGVLERITYQNQENGFTVARLQEEGKHGRLTTIIGPLAGVSVGATLEFAGAWVHDPRHGDQFKIDSFTILKPNTLHGMERYLGSGMIKGVGPQFAGRIVKHFGLNTLDVLEKTPERLAEVPGLGKKRVDSIRRAWASQREIHQIMIFLQGHNISANYAVKIYKTYGRDALKVVQGNPYRLAEDIWGIGFKKADQIALSTGVPTRDARRAQAGLLFVLQQAANDGHCFVPLEGLVASGGKLLELDAAYLEGQIPTLAGDEKIVLEAGGVYLPGLYFAEQGVTASLDGLAKGDGRLRLKESEKAIAMASRQMKLVFAPEQIAALQTAIAQKISVLTGGPGTGKSTILKALILILEKQGLRIELAAPTGRAAKRLAEATGREARTIHRLLEFDPAVYDFKRNRQNPLSADLVIIDEISMLDILLANALFKAVPVKARLVMVGDADQLPSVGPGNVLRDIIAAGRIPVVSLTKIFRQDEGSLISLNAVRINAGEKLELLTGYERAKDFYCIYREQADDIEQEVLSLCQGRLKAKYGFDPLRDIQVITPMRKGVIGTENLNARLQEVFHPGEKLFSAWQNRFRVGDKVMQLRNNYDKEVFNGDLGYVTGGSDEEQTLLLNFDGREIRYELAELNELELAYAITVHKSQGSEFPCVIIPVHTVHYPLLQRNLLYTGVTRGKKMVIIIGSSKAIAIAIRSNRVEERNTSLKKRLRDAGL